MSVTVNSPTTRPHLHHGYQLPYFKKGKGRPNSFSAEDMNKIVAVCNALLRGRIVRGARDKLHVSDHELVWELARSAAGASDEEPDASVQSGVDNEINDAAWMGDGRIMIGGAFTRVNGVYRERTAILNNNLSNDDVYFGGADGTSPLVFSVSYVNNDPDPSNGDLLSTFWAGGRFKRVGDLTLTYDNLAIASQYGDPTGTGYSGGVSPSGGAVTRVLGVRLPATTGDSSVGLISGSFTSVNGSATTIMAAVNPDGTIEPAFSNAALVAGGVTSGSGVTYILEHTGVGVNNAYPGDSLFYLGLGTGTFFGITAGLIRIFGDGTVDTGFQPYWSTSPGVRAVTLYPGNKVIALCQPGDATDGCLIRMGDDGSYDSSFQPGFFDHSDLSPEFNSHAVDSAGRVVAGGHFDTWTTGSVATARQNLVRVHSDGTLDTDFDVPVVFNDASAATINKVLIEPATDIIYIFGNFDRVGGLVKERMARITPAGIVL